ncbi:MAG: phage tail protein [Bacteroidales bacterium]|nr:phage tail protein [Bacteroidales bacterium]MBR1625605.1 phage tail protein [Bacteroidales bacterium]
MSNTTVITGITNAGLSILAQAQLGAQIQFTKIKIGDGRLEQGQDPAELTDLINTVNELGIYNWTMAGDSTIKVTGLIVQGNTGFYFREIGLFAIDPTTNQEVLYAYGNKGEAASYIPENTSSVAVEERATIITKVANAETVKIQLSHLYGPIFYDELGDTTVEIDLVTNIINAVWIEV